MILACDIDKTVADAEWRDGLLGDWEEYYPAGDRDKPIRQMVVLVNHLEWWTVALTGRPERWRAATMSWLVRNGVMFDELIMRPDDDRRRSPELKVALLLERFPEEVAAGEVLVVDDREDVAAAMAAAGIPSLQFRKGVAS